MVLFRLEKHGRLTMALWVDIKNTSKTITKTNLPERLEKEGFQFLDAKELGKIVGDLDPVIERLYQSTSTWSTSDIFNFGMTQVLVLVGFWLTVGISIDFIIMQTIVAFLLLICADIALRILARRRIRLALIRTFETIYEPSVDQQARVMNVSNWMRAVWQVRLKDGRTTVAIRAPGLKLMFLAIDHYRK